MVEAEKTEEQILKENELNPNNVTKYQTAAEIVNSKHQKIGAEMQSVGVGGQDVRRQYPLFLFIALINLIFSLNVPHCF